MSRQPPVGISALALLCIGCASSASIEPVSAAAPERQAPIAACEGVTPPLPEGLELKPLHAPQPQPGLLKTTSAYACVAVTIDERGRVGDAELVSTDNVAFAESFLRIVGRWRFEPLVKNGESIAARTTLISRYSSDH